MPYFGAARAARQGVSSRHGFMLRLAQHLLHERTGHPFKILELGSWVGGSAITWAQAIRDAGAAGTVVCVDPWEQYVDLEVDANPADENDVYVEMARALASGEAIELFRHNVRASGLAGYVTPIRGSSREILPRFLNGEFDLVYVDGDHAYDKVKEDLVEAARLVAPGGALCGDDLEVQRSAVDPDYVWPRIGQDVIIDPATGLGFHAGVTMAVGEFFGCDVTSRDGFWAMQKGQAGWTWFEHVDFRNVALPPHLASPSADLYHSVASECIKRQQLGDAATVLRACLNEEPNDPAAAFKLANIERQLACRPEKGAAII